MKEECRIKAVVLYRVEREEGRGFNKSVCAVGADIAQLRNTELAETLLHFIRRDISVLKLRNARLEQAQHQEL